MELVCIAIGLVVTQAHTFVKIPQTKHLRSVHFIVGEFYVSQFLNLTMEALV